MMSFLKSFLSGEKSCEEKALLAEREAAKKHDVLTIPGAEPEKVEKRGGCGGCGCR